MPKVRNTTTGQDAIAIRKLREKTNLTQLDFSAMFHIPVNNLQKWEQGINKPPAYVVYMMTQILNMNEELEQLKLQQK